MHRACVEQQLDTFPVRLMLVVEVVEVVEEPVLQREMVWSLRVAGVSLLGDDVGIGDRGPAEREALTVAVIGAARPQRVARRVEEVAVALTEQISGGWSPLDDRVLLPGAMQRHL